MQIYLAGPFFNEKERHLVETAALILRNQGYEVIVPMEHFIENGEKLTNEEWAREVFDYDVEQIRNDSKRKFHSCVLQGLLQQPLFSNRLLIYGAL